MKTPEPSQENPSAVSTRIFSYPRQLNSACAEVLSRLLDGEALTSADTLERCATMRAAAAVHYLKQHYGWPILSDTRTTGCSDGRVVTISFYYLPAEVIHAACAADAGEWRIQVHQERAKLRANAADAYRRAAKIELSRKHKTLPGQGDFFTEA